MKTPRVHDFDPNAKVPQLGSPMDDLPSIQKPSENQITSKLANQQTSKEVNQQGSKLANLQTSKEAKKQTTLPANQQTSKLVKKVGTYLTPESIRELKRIAWETDRKEYEVLQEAVDHYIQQRHT